MNLLLCDTQAEIINLCGDIKGLSVNCGNIFEQHFDALITPGNSYAFMDNGFDLLVSQKYGWHIQKKIREGWIKNCELIPVGGAIGEQISDSKMLIYTPTMEVPMTIGHTWNVYLAMKAGLRYAHRSSIKKAVFPIFADNNMNPLIFKKQLQAAIDDYEYGKDFNSWQEAQAYYFNLVNV